MDQHSGSPDQRNAVLRVEAQQAALLDVARSGVLWDDFSAACQRLTEVMAEALQVERVSIWILSEDGSELVLKDLHNLSERRHRAGMVLRKADFPRYFAALEESRAISVPLARSDTRTSELSATYLVPLGIESMLDAAVWRAGRTYGVVCAESVGVRREWHPDEQQFAASVADLVASARESHIHKQAQARLAATEERFEVAFQLNPDAMILVRAEDRVVSEVNRNFELQSGYRAEEVQGRDIAELNLWVSTADRDEWNLRISSKGSVRDFETELRMKDGTVQLFQVSSEWVLIDDTAYVLTAARNITQQRRQEHIVRELGNSMAGATGANFFRNLVDGLAETLGADLALVGELSPAREGMVNTVAVCDEGKAANNYSFPLSGSPCMKVLNDGMCCVPDGVAELYPADSGLARRGMRAYVGAALFDSAGHPLGLMAVLFKSPLQDRDVVESILRIFATRAAAELERLLQLKELEFRASHDLLSGLPNRLRLERTIASQISGSHPGQGSLLLIDLDRFKEINDTLGHAVGDSLLLRVAKRLQSDMQQAYDGTVARLGGDEFGIWLPHVRTDAEAEAGARRALEAITAPFEVSGYRLEIGASIGIARFPDHGDSATELFRRADIAMYQAKRAGTGFEIYLAEDDPYSPERLGLMSQLGSAVRAGEFELYYQPRLHLSNRLLAGFEALVRWRHPRLGQLPPGQFIPLAELSDAIRPLTLWIFDAALKEQAAWRTAGCETAVAINLSPRLLMDRGCPDQIEALLRRHDANPALVECEVTESSLIVDTGRVSDTLRQLSEMGLKIAIDDFGTGYSSLSHLKRLPLHALKIDVSFVTHMLRNEQDAAIVSSTIGLAHNLGLRVVAEGIEDEDTLLRLKELGCDEGQGYWIARPLPVTDMPRWLQ